MALFRRCKDVENEAVDVDAVGQAVCVARPKPACGTCIGVQPLTAMAFA